MYRIISNTKNEISNGPLLALKTTNKNFIEEVSNCMFQFVVLFSFISFIFMRHPLLLCVTLLFLCVTPLNFVHHPSYLCVTHLICVSPLLFVCHPSYLRVPPHQFTCPPHMFHSESDSRTLGRSLLLSALVIIYLWSPRFFVIMQK